MNKRTLRKASPDDKVIHLFPAGALDYEPDRDGDRWVPIYHQ